AAGSLVPTTLSKAAQGRNFALLVGALRDGAAFERRIMPEDQHEDGRQKWEERDRQQAGSEAAGRVLQVTHRVGGRKSCEIADRIDQGDAAGRSGAAEERGRQCPEQRRDREETD